MVPPQPPGTVVAKLVPASVLVVVLTEHVPPPVCGMPWMCVPKSTDPRSVVVEVNVKVRLVSWPPLPFVASQSTMPEMLASRSLHVAVGGSNVKSGLPVVTPV